MHHRLPAGLVYGLGTLGLVGVLAGCAAETPHGDYADGTYTALGSYTSPGGREGIGVSLTIQGDVVTEVSVEPGAVVGLPALFQERFAAGVHDEVVGKDIDVVEVHRIAGSSLTSEAFNQAVEQIREDAAD